MLSPSALNQFLGCEYRTHLGIVERRGLLKGERRPASLTVLLERGEAFEADVLTAMEAKGRRVISLDKQGRGEMRAQRTFEAMREGYDVIHQGCFASEQWVGYPDFLIRVDTPSTLGDYSYEVYDAKLGGHARTGYIFQLLFYTEELARLQGIAPARMHLILGNGERPGFEPRDFEAYARRIEAMFLERRAELESGAEPAYPYPVADCDFCPWWAHCRDKRRADDHLSLVANLQKRQGLLLEAEGVHDVTSLASLENDVEIPDLAKETLAALRAQADLQWRSRGREVPLHELLEPAFERGLGRLPARSDGDVFFDFEGDPNWGEDGLEYLFGSVVDGESGPEFHALWADSRASEKRALEQWMDWIAERLDRDPGMHVYHYNAYEPTALKRLVARHATHEAELDALLRRRVFVDLYGIVRQAVRAGVESYGLKGIEALYRFERNPELGSAIGSLVRWQEFLDTGSRAPLDEIALYNRDDCLSTRALLQWFHERRPEAELQFGVVIDELAAKPPYPPSDAALAREARTEALRAMLVADLPDDESEDTPDERARRLMFSLASYHVREAKPAWWAFFERETKTVEQLRRDDGDAIGGLTELGREQVKQSWHIRFAYPPQEHKLAAGKPAVDPFTAKGVTIAELDDARGELTIARSTKSDQPLPVALGPGGPIDVKNQIDAVFELAEDVATQGLDRPGVGRDLLLARPPRFTPGTPALGDEAFDLPRLTAQVKALEQSTLVIQGPPGTGKTYNGARVALSLLDDGLKVGVTSTSHKAIDNFCRAVDEAADESDTSVSFRGWRLGGEYASERICNSAKLDESGGPVLLRAATAWWWSRPENAGNVDVLFVDEAGQMSLADAIAVGRGARSMVLLGDPQQLAHVSQGSHPFGSGASVLEHMLGDADTIPADRGVLLSESWRMHPGLCRFISDAMYDGRLFSHPRCARQRIDSDSLSGTGIRMFELAHVGNRGRSPQEAELIARQIAVLLDSGTYTDCDGRAGPFTLDDVLVVTPYNAQVRCLKEALPSGTRVGTVDKFQGQEAPVVFFSMATSSAEDVSRGMGFLFSRNRLNVAISRAQALAVIVCSPQLLRARCTTVEDMKLVNLLCLAADEAARHPMPPAKVSIGWSAA